MQATALTSGFFNTEMTDRLLTCNSCPNWQMILFVHFMLQYIARLIERLLTAVRVYALMAQAEGRALPTRFDSSKCNIHYMYECGLLDHYKSFKFPYAMH